MPKRYLISGYFGFSNAGDEAILSVLLQDLRQAAPGAELYVLSGNPTETAQQHAVQAIPTSDLQALLDTAAACDGLIVGGGGVFQDYWGAQKETLLTPLHAGIPYYSSIPMLGWLLEKPVLIHAAGVGPLFSKDAVELTRLSFKLAAFASVRDAESQTLLIAHGLSTEDVTIAADPAFRLILDRQQADNLLADLPLDPQTPRIAVCLRGWEQTHPAEEWQEHVAEALDAFADLHECNLLFFPFQHLPGSNLTDDVEVARNVIAKMRHSKRAFLVENSPHPPILAGLIASCDLTLGMRYHSVVFSSLGGVPAVALAYDEKVTHVMSDLGLKEYCLPFAELSSEIMLERLNSAWNNRVALRSLVEAGCREMSERANINRTMVKRFIQAKVEENSSETNRFFKQFSLDQSRLLTHKIEDLRKLTTELSSQLETNQELLGIISEKNASIRELTERITAQEVKLSQGAKELDAITGSRGWKLLLWLWNIRKLFLPPGSGRERLARYIWRRLHRATSGHGYLFKLQAPPPFEKRYVEEDNSQVTLYTDDIHLLPDYKNRRPLHNELPDHLQVTLIASVKNEAGSVKDWLHDIQNQSRLPDEIIIVDGGSKDGTYEILETFTREASLPARLISSPGANIARARNIATDQASHPIIAVTDFGCRPDRLWLEHLLQPFKLYPETRVSSGFYRSVDSQGQDHSGDGIWLGVSDVDPRSFLPSCRSVAFQKGVLDAVGGFPEWLTRTGEDTYLDLELKRLGGAWAFVPDAMVDWVIPDSIPSYLQKLFDWSIGDGESGVHAHYYWDYFIRWIIWLAFTLFTVTTFIGMLVWKPAHTPLWLSLCALVWLGAVIGLAIKEKLPLPRLVQKALGQGAQVLGFLKGARNRRVVDQRRENELKGVFFLFSGVPLDDSGGGVRGTQITLELLRRSWGVVFLHKFARDESRDLGLRYPHPHLFQSSVEHFNLDEFAGQHPTLLTKSVAALIEFPLPDFLPLTEHLRKKYDAAIAYDLLDDWTTSLGGKWYTAEIEKQIIQVSTHLVTTLPLLANRLKNISGREVLLLPNAVNARLFDPHRVHLRPEDLPNGKRILIYVGALWGEWFDWELLGSLADAQPKSQIVLIGDYRGQAPFKKNNVYFLGLKAQSDLPAYLAHADAAMLPWKVSAITQATSPLKVYEYLSMRLPVVAPDLEPLRGMPGVFSTDSRDEYLRLAGSVNRHQLDEDEVDRFIQKHNWTTRVNELLSFIDRHE